MNTKSDYIKPVADHITQCGAIPRIVVDHPAAQAELFLQGGHLARWKPAGEPAVLFVSPLAKFEPGQPIRGGVPICFPWFGPNAENPNLPSHGFARTQAWDLMKSESDAEGVKLALQLRSSDLTQKLWPHRFVADLQVNIGAALAMTLTITNTGDAAMTFETALHSYFSISDVNAIKVSGLAGTEYLDKPDAGKRKTDPQPAITFGSETDRVYQNTAATCIIHDPGERREIVIEKQGSRSTVVWNPGQKRADQLADLGAANWTPFVCVETANVGENAVELPPGQTHTTALHVSVRRG